MTGKTRSLKMLIAISLFFQRIAPKATRQIMADHAAKRSSKTFWETKSAA